MTFYNYHLKKLTKAITIAERIPLRVSPSSEYANLRIIKILNDIPRNRGKITLQLTLLPYMQKAFIYLLFLFSSELQYKITNFFSLFQTRERVYSASYLFSEFCSSPFHACIIYSYRRKVVNTICSSSVNKLMYKVQHQTVVV